MKNNHNTLKNFLQPYGIDYIPFLKIIQNDCIDFEDVYAELDSYELDDVIRQSISTLIYLYGVNTYTTDEVTEVEVESLGLDKFDAEGLSADLSRVEKLINDLKNMLHFY